MKMFQFRTLICNGFSALSTCSRTWVYCKCVPFWNTSVLQPWPTHACSDHTHIRPILAHIHGTRIATFRTHAFLFYTPGTCSMCTNSEHSDVMFLHTFMEHIHTSIRTHAYLIWTPRTRSMCINSKHIAVLFLHTHRSHVCWMQNTSMFYLNTKDVFFMYHFRTPVTVRYAVTDSAHF